MAEKQSKHQCQIYWHCCVGFDLLDVVLPSRGAEKRFKALLTNKLQQIAFRKSESIQQLEFFLKKIRASDVICSIKNSVCGCQTIFWYLRT